MSRVAVNQHTSTGQRDLDDINTETIWIKVNTLDRFRCRKMITRTWYSRYPFLKILVYVILKLIACNNERGLISYPNNWPNLK